MVIGWSPCLDSESTAEGRSMDGSVDAAMTDATLFDTTEINFEISDQNYRLATIDCLSSKLFL